LSVCVGPLITEGSLDRPTRPSCRVPAGHCCPWRPAPSSTTCARSSASSASAAGPSSPGRSSTTRGHPRRGTDGALRAALDPEEV